ncbi:hypothetical protein SGQ44_15900 [Flavobacterium sp. Fl-77]|uniref:Uncharacterized protein n=1 Tax=Flavobacterium flavipigmentatum TaxID=2893884 RepID=A0AAJ2S9S2_9FLAO|nr:MULTISPECIES: hypothetical protein [unclassified Flavobacterium]MDX6183791.1 hypothetical protein [Flavobacterium sp. Fl-33]MDX6187248.1 hypothetical protein [Flavobacterium sp. Fl-77]UFH38063.1 hypothetical protein LNP22_15145 [Flavobacterium sp. F-70]
MNKKSRRKKPKKIIPEESYSEYIKKVIKNIFTQPTSLVYCGFALVLIALYWYDSGFENMLRMLFLLINASVIMLFLGEILGTIISKKIDKNSVITQLIVISILTFISFFFFDENFRYWSFVLGILLFIPILIHVVVNEIRIWLNF